MYGMHYIMSRTVAESRTASWYNGLMRKRQEKSEVHNRVGVLRVAHGLSRQDLATAVGVTFQTIGYLERGEYSPSIELALRLATFFNVPVEQIFSLTPFPPLSETLRAAQKGE